MKKLTIATLISAALSTSAFAGDDMDKIDTTFADLDNDDNGYISREEADDDEISEHFSKIDANSDMQLSMKEFNTHVMKYPQHFDDDVLASAQSMKDSMNGKGMMEDDMMKSDVDVDSAIDEQVATLHDKSQSQELYTETETRENETVTQKDMSDTSEDSMVAKGEFEMMDANSDGELTKAEASRSGVTDDFDKIDANDDELITRMEYTRYQRMSEGSTEDSSEE